MRQLLLEQLDLCSSPSFPRITLSLLIKSFRPDEDFLGLCGSILGALKPSAGPSVSGVIMSLIQNPISGSLHLICLCCTGSAGVSEHRPINEPTDHLRPD